MIEKINFKLFEKEFFLGDSIDNSLHKKSFFKKEIESRVKALGISFLSLACAGFDMIYMGRNIIGGLAFSAIHLKSPLKYASNKRNISVAIVEFARHVFGTLSGSIIGVVSPTTSRNLFLPVDQTDMETRSENMTKEQAGKLYDMLYEIDQLFEEKEIDYIMTGGTQLGAVRHGGIIPWDDDADVFYLKKDEEKIFALKEKLNAIGLDIIRCHLGFKIFDMNGTPVNEKDLEYKYPFVDICTAIEKDGKVTYESEHFRTNYAGEYFTKEEWDNRTKQNFGPIKLYGAKNAEKFCRRAFGENVMQYGFQLLNHRTFTKEIPRKFYLKRNVETGMCKPIEYTLPENSRVGKNNAS